MSETKHLNSSNKFLVAATALVIGIVLGVVAYAQAKEDSTPTPKVDATETTVRSNGTTTTTTAPQPQIVEVPGPERVVTEYVEVPVLPQACRDLAAFTVDKVNAIVGQWNAWAAAHAGGATVEQYQQIVNELIASGNAAVAEGTPLALGCIQ